MGSQGAADADGTCPSLRSLDGYCQLTGAFPSWSMVAAQALSLEASAEEKAARIKKVHLSLVLDC